MYSPAVVDIPNGPEAEQSLIQHTLDFDKSTLSASDTEGLNLNITLPGDVSKASRLPVFLFVHGGGFLVGSATWPQYDFAKFVHLGKANGLPCIAINFNYRLSAPGLLASQELRDAGYTANNSIRDQRTAILWVRKYIAGFGGDPENITLGGESAGSVSCSYHLQSKEPLFKRIILMSGTSLLMSPVPPQVAEVNYQKALKTLDLPSTSVAERTKSLLTTDSTGMYSKLMTIPMLPVIDDELPLVPQSFSEFETGKLNLAGTDWCEAMMIGDCQFDGNIQGLRLMHRKKGLGAVFCESMQKSFSTAEITDKLLNAYGIKPDLDNDTAFFRILQVANDIGFYIPTTTYAEGFHKHMKTYMYRFNEPNPWDGPWKGQSTHILDIAFLFQNFNQFLAEPQRQLAEQFALDTLAFVSGKAPWDGWTNEKRVARVLGPGGKVEVIEDEPEKVGRRKVLFELAAELPGGMDHISEAFNGFMRG